MANNHYVTPRRLKTFLDNLKNLFALSSHKHTLSDLTDYTVDTSLSSTSSNPVANKVLNEEFEEIATAMNALDSSIDTKANLEHEHSISEVTNLQSSLDAKVSTSRTINGKALSSNITLSASDIGADPSGSAANALNESKSYTDTKTSGLASTSSVNTSISNHNTSTSAHNDIRNLITGLTNRLNALADSDDATLDQMSEIVTYIKSNKSLIDSVTTSKVNVTDIIDNLETNVNNKPLSAAQGVEIKKLINDLQAELDSHKHTVSEISDLTATATELNYMDGVTSNVQAQIDSKADSTHTHSNASLGQGCGYCSTSSSTVEKTVSLSNYTAKTGGIVSVEFVYSVPASATMNINNTGASQIYYRGSAITKDIIKGGDTATFIFDGIRYHLITVDRWHEDIVDLQATDEKVKQMSTSANGNFRLLLTPSYQTETTTAQTYFNSNLYANPSTNKIYANISGTATGLENLTATVDELNHVSGATSNIQEQIETNKNNIVQLHEDIGDQENQYSALTLRVKNLEDSESGATEEQIAQIETNKNDIADLKTNKANITDVKAWIVQQTPLFAESEEWLAENGDTSKVYILDGEIYAYMYKESDGPSYTNWLPLSTDTDRKTVFNGTGYKDGFRLNSSGVQTACAGMMVTGFIPCKAGDKIRVKNNGDTTTSYTQNVSFYDSANTHLGHTSLATDNVTDANLGVGITRSEDKTELTIDTSAISQASKITNCNAVRIASGDLSNAIITVNEEIIDSGSSGGYGWYSTGHTFVPADYEDRIIAIETAIKNGDIGGRLEITSIVESTEDGGSNIITFSDGRTLTVQNGKTGKKGQNGSDGENGTVQIEPLFAESVTWLNSNGNTSKLYILPDNYVYAYMDGLWKSTGNQFVANGSESSVQKYLNDRNTYIAPVPSGFCESLNEYTDYSVTINYAVDLETQMERFSSLASTYSNYVTETLLGKDASNTYNIYKYELDLNPPIDDAYTSVMKKDKPVFIITAGLHGIEHDAVDEVYHFMKDLCENHMDSDYFDYLRNNVKFVIVPISNPWGYVNLTYNNSNDVNLNKNFEHGFSQVTGGIGSSQNTGANAYSEVETVLLKGVFDEYSDAIFHLECHGKASNDTSWETILWFSNMASLKSELIELCSTRTIHQIGCRLHRLGFDITDSECGWITYYTPNGRPKDYTGTEYGMLSTTMEGTGRMGVAGHTTYTKHEQRINCEALENFVLRVLDSLNSRVEI